MEEDDAAAAAGLGSALGCKLSVARTLSKWVANVAMGEDYLIHHADDESFLLNLVGLDGVLILQDFAYRLVNGVVAPEMVARVSQTGVDQLLQLGLPSLLL